MTTALIWNLIWAPKETEAEGTQKEKRHWCPHNTATGHPSHLQVSVRTTHSSAPVLLKSTLPWTLQTHDDLPACLQCPPNPSISQNQTAAKSSSFTLPGLALHLFLHLQRPSADPCLRRWTQPCFLHPRTRASSTMPAQPMALCLHNAAELRGIFPSSLFQKCQVLSAGSKEREISQSHP